MSDGINIPITAKDQTAPAFKSTKEALIALRAEQIKVAQESLRAKSIDNSLKVAKFSLISTTNGARVAAIGHKMALAAEANAARILATQERNASKATADMTRLSLQQQRNELAAQKEARMARQAAAKATDKESDSTKKASTVTQDFNKKLSDLSQSAIRRAEVGLQSLASRVARFNSTLVAAPFTAARRGFDEIGSIASASADKLENFVKTALRLTNITPIIRGVEGAFSSLFGKLGNLPSLPTGAIAGGITGGVGKLGSDFEKAASAGIRAFTSSLSSAGETSKRVVSNGIKPLDSSLITTDSLLRKIAVGSLRGMEAALAAMASATRTSIGVLSTLVIGFSGMPNPIRLATSALGGMLDFLGKIGLAANGVKALSSTLVTLAHGLTSGNAGVEQITVSMDTFLGSADATQKMLKELSGLAFVSPFGVKQLDATANKLLSLKFDAAQVIPLLTAVGNAVSAMGTGNEGIDRITLAIEQIKAKGRVQGDELMQLMEAGLPALQMLATGFGVTTEQMNKMVEEGIVPADKAIQILIDQMNARYPDMMKVQATTFNGMLSNLQDWAYQTSLILTKPFFEPAKRGLKAFLDYVTSPAGQQAVQNLAGRIQRGVDRMTAAFERLRPKIKPVMADLEITAKILISKYTGAFVNIIKNLDYFIDRFTKLGLIIGRVRYVLSPLTLAFEVLNGLFKGGLAGGIAAFQKRLYDIHVYIGNALKLINDTLDKYGPGIANWLETTASLIAKKAVVLGEAFVSWVAPYIPKLITELLKLGNSLLDWVVGYAPRVAERVMAWGKSFIEWVGPVAAQLISRLGSLAQNLITWITLKAPLILNELKTWGTAFIDWMLPLAGRIAQRLLALLTAVLNWVQDHADEILNQLQTWAESFLGWVLPMIPRVIDALGGVLNKVISWVINSAPKVLDALLKWAESFIDWVTPLVGQIMRNLRDLIDTLLRWISKNAPRIVNQLLDWAFAFLKWIDPLIPLLVNALARVVSSILNWIIANAPALLTMLMTWVDQFLTAFNSLVPQILAALGVVIQTLLTWIFDHGPDILAMLVNWAVQFMDWALGLFDALKPNLEVFINKVLQWLVDRGPDLLNKLWGWIQQSMSIVMQLFNYIQPVLFQLVAMLGNWIRTNATDILNKFWAFFSMGLNLATELMRFITPVLSGIVGEIGNWIVANAADILNKFWGFFSAGLDVVIVIMDKLKPILEKLVPAIGTWITENAGKILDAFFSFFASVADVVKTIMKALEPVLKDLIPAIGVWIVNNTKTILDALLSFLTDVASVVKTIMTALEPVLEKLIPAIGGWIELNAEKLVKMFFSFFDWIVKNAARFLEIITPAATAVMGALGKAMSDHADELVKTLTDSIVESIKKDPESWGKVGETAIAAMLGPIGWGAALFGEWLKSQGMHYENPRAGGNPIDNLKDPPTGPLPKKALGDTSFMGGAALWAEKGFERLALPGGPTFYASGPVYSPDIQAGSKFTPARDMGLGGGEIHIHNHLTIYGQPDKAMLSEIDRRVERGVKNGLSEIKGDAQNIRTIKRTRG